ncbi:MAG: hypothetical protein LBL65_06360 [Campylobacteraceae bacterium]|jgi:hypothetical protein|nr:hypothetical protein [Campylobacteraceae bacterium]
MNFGKTIIMALLFVVMFSIPANAWGKKEQGFLLGAATAVTLPHLINHRHYEPARYYSGHYRNRDILYARPDEPTIINIERDAPEIIYIENVKNDDNILMHRRVRTHNYLNNRQADRIIIQQRVIIIDR